MELFILLVSMAFQLCDIGAPVLFPLVMYFIIDQQAVWYLNRRADKEQSFNLSLFHICGTQYKNILLVSD